MSQQKIPEVHLEVCGGFFRIPTDKVVYNITVLETKDSSLAKVLDGIVQAEKREPQAEAKLAVAAVEGYEADHSPVGDDYYKEAATYYSGEFNRLTGEAAAFAQSVEQSGNSDSTPAQVLEKLAQTNTIIAAAKQLLDDIQSQASPLAEELQRDLPDKAGAGKELAEAFKEVREDAGKLKNIIAALAEKVQETKNAGVAQDPGPQAKRKKTRYLFDLDTVFQTIYELCTNETVKEHSQKARAKAAELFDPEIFLDYLSERVKSYQEDDGFLSVPLTDVLTGLRAGCRDQKTANLLKNMEKQQADIFLDQFLPLEVPATEEMEIESKASGAGEEPGSSAAQGTVAEFGEALGLIDRVEAALGTLAASQAEGLAHIAPAEAGIGAEGKIKADEAADILGEIAAHIDWVRGEIGKSAPAPLSDRKTAEVLREIKSTAAALASCLAMKNEHPDLAFSPQAREETAPLAEVEALGAEAVGESVEEGEDGEELDIVEDIDVDDVEFAVDEETEADIDDRQAEIDETLAGISAANSLEEEKAADFEEELEFSGDDSSGEAEEAEEDFGEASQDDIDKLLEEMGG